MAKRSEHKRFGCVMSTGFDSTSGQQGIFLKVASGASRLLITSRYKPVVVTEEPSLTLRRVNRRNAGNVLNFLYKTM